MACGHLKHPEWLAFRGYVIERRRVDEGHNDKSQLDLGRKNCRFWMRRGKW